MSGSKGTKKKGMVIPHSIGNHYIGSINPTSGSVNPTSGYIINPTSGYINPTIGLMSLSPVIWKQWALMEPFAHIISIASWKKFSQGLAFSKLAHDMFKNWLVNLPVPNIPPRRIQM